MIVKDPKVKDSGLTKGALRKIYDLLSCDMLNFLEIERSCSIYSDLYIHSHRAHAEQVPMLQTLQLDIARQEVKD